MLYHVNVCMCARMHAAEHILKLLRRDQNVCVPPVHLYNVATSPGGVDQLLACMHARACKHMQVRLGARVRNKVASQASRDRSVSLPVKTETSAAREDGDLRCQHQSAKHYYNVHLRGVGVISKQMDSVSLQVSKHKRKHSIVYERFKTTVAEREG